MLRIPTLRSQFYPRRSCCSVTQSPTHSCPTGVGGSLCGRFKWPRSWVNQLGIKWPLIGSCTTIGLQLTQLFLKNRAEVNCQSFAMTPCLLSVGAMAAVLSWGKFHLARPQGVFKNIRRKVRLPLGLGVVNSAPGIEAVESRDVTVSDKDLSNPKY